jgi:acyl-coenzyme A thioesterase PaaI-like protein
MKPRRDPPATMIDLLRRHRASYTDTDLARVAAAEAGRELIRQLADTMVSAGELQQVTALVEEAAAILAAGPHGRAYTGSAEGSLNQGSDLSFVDYSPFVGPMSPLAPPIDVEVADDRILGRVRYPLAFEGPPGHVHGGFIAAGFDEVLGFAQALSGQSGMTGRLEIRYRSPTPLRSEVVYAAGVQSIDGRKVTCWGTLHDGETLCAEATGLFITMNPTKLASLMARRARDSETEGGVGEHGE